jgi:hypothetical protein
VPLSGGGSLDNERSMEIVLSAIVMDLSEPCPARQLS